MSTHISFDFGLNLSKIPWKLLLIVKAFLSFKGTNHAYLLKTSITYIKKRIRLLIAYLLNHPSNFCFKGEYTLHFSKFLITDLWNFSANFCFSEFFSGPFDYQIYLQVQQQTCFEPLKQTSLRLIKFGIFSNIKSFIM